MSDSVISTQDLKDHISNTIHKTKDYLASGSCSSYQDYQYYVGRIHGLEILAKELDTLKLSD